MKKMNVLISMILCILMIELPTYADLIPKELDKALHEYQLKCDSKTYTWNIKALEETVPPSQDELRNAITTVSNDVELKIKKQGISDRKYIDSRIKKEVEIETVITSGHSIKTNGIFNVSNQGSETLIDATFENTNTKPASVMKKSALYYFKDNLTLNSTISSATKFETNPNQWLEERPMTGNSWYALGTSVNYRSVLPQPFDLTPEEVVLISGHDVLELYGIEWKLISSTPDKYILSGQMIKDEHFNMQIIIDRKHGNLPIDITATQSRPKNPYVRHFRVISFKQIDGTYFPSVITYDGTYPKILTRKRQWTLVSYKPVQPILLKIPTSVSITDFRLLNKNGITVNDVHKAMSLNDPHQLTYSWQGRILSDAELENMMKAKHPEIRIHDRNVWLIATIGFLIIITGLMYYRIKLRESKI